MRWRRLSGITVVLLVLGGAMAAAPEGTQVQLTVTPTMVRGPDQAPVVIVEFSDYQ
jgi:protein-disulfide isomerase